jgi:hypothetical protein
MDDEDFRQMVLKDVLINLQEEGFDINPGNDLGLLKKLQRFIEIYDLNILHTFVFKKTTQLLVLLTEEPKEAVAKLKSMAFEMAKNYGFEINEEMEWPEIKEKIMNVMREKGVPVGMYMFSFRKE